jgi:hypothetical protein
MNKQQIGIVRLNEKCKIHFKKNKAYLKLEKKYAPTLDNYGQSCFVRSDFLKMKCVCKTQMMPRLIIRNYK